MPRVPRHQSAPGVMCPGTLYHVMSHAVAGTWLFETVRDRVVFLAFLAWQCRERGLVVHAFCLMGNHVHGILEDRRGQLSQAMSLVKSRDELLLVGHAPVGNATAPRSVHGCRRFRGSREARFTRPRATHGYFIDRSAVADCAIAG